MHGRTLLAVLTLAFETACASGRLPDTRGLDVIVKARPSSISADDAGARTVASATGCDVEFVRVLATGAMLLRLWPTRGAPDVQRCMAQLRATPGVDYAAPDVPMKASQFLRRVVT